MANYLKYQQRKLQEQISLSPYNQLRSEISQVGRETQKIARQTDATLKRQSVPLGARIEGQRQLQTNYAQNIGAAYDRVSTQDQQRKQDLMLQLDEVNMRLEEAEKLEDQKGKAMLSTAIQVVSTGAGAAFGGIPGAQIGAAAGQAISGVVGAVSGDADEQDWANIGMGVVSGLGVFGEQAALNSVKAENAEAQAYLADLSGRLNDNQRVEAFGMIRDTLSAGRPLSEARAMIDSFFPPPEMADTTIESDDPFDTPIWGW